MASLLDVLLTPPFSQLAATALCSQTSARSARLGVEGRDDGGNASPPPTAVQGLPPLLVDNLAHRVPEPGIGIRGGAEADDVLVRAGEAEALWRISVGVLDADLPALVGLDRELGDDDVDGGDPRSTQRLEERKGEEAAEGRRAQVVAGQQAAHHDHERETGAAQRHARHHARRREEAHGVLQLVRREEDAERLAHIRWKAVRRDDRAVHDDARRHVDDAQDQRTDQDREAARHLDVLRVRLLAPDQAAADEQDRDGRVVHVDRQLTLVQTVPSLQALRAEERVVDADKARSDAAVS
ncbi:hypothetical protein A1Q2_07574 [Trichosporon asahii var. asahii CBS 8904]|uniref:Uncharacterized protein n=1 Tax=Trichosporon asahii var. asahii (strain CBS 8904) TaxID=1220162 RepID=K1VNA9_TRIAC|nr:hypothetical protein A1Q2_07574 [Trichosporon asahii var. asahii CBS 8904]